jgi:hypothetical protein
MFGYDSGEVLGRNLDQLFMDEEHKHQMPLTELLFR